MVHFAKTAYVTFLWGCHLTHILECVFLGQQLKRVSKVRRIVYVASDEVPLRALLTMYWEIREYKHLTDGPGTSERLSKVYSKLLAWNTDHNDVQVCVLMDTDLWVTSSLDDLFTRLEFGMCAGVFRGNANFPLNAPRPAKSIKKADHPGGGGINGGVIVLKPDKTTYSKMLNV